MQVFVLGMHRSGTSALARVLNLMGLYFGGEDVGIGRSAENEKGFWERRDVRVLNDAMLFEAGCDWDCLSSLDVEGLPVQQKGRYVALAGDIVLKLDAHRPWFVKEPRLCALLPIWRAASETPVCVHVFRNPLEVASSLRERNGLPLPVGLALWEAYNIRALAGAAGLPRLFMRFESLLQRPAETVGTAHAALRTLGDYPLRMPAEAELTRFLDPRMHRCRHSEDELRGTASAGQLALYNLLRDAANAPDASPEAPTLTEESQRVLVEYETTVDLGSRKTHADVGAARRSDVGLALRVALKDLDLSHANARVEEAQETSRRFERKVDTLQAAVRGYQAQLAQANEAARGQRAQLAQAKEAARGQRAELAQANEAARGQRAQLAQAKEAARGQRAQLAQANEAARGYLAQLTRANEGARDVERQRDALAKRNAGMRSSIRKAAEAGKARHGRTLAAVRRWDLEIRLQRARFAESRQLAALLEDHIRALLASKRWRLGNALVSLATLSLGRRDALHEVLVRADQAQESRREAIRTMANGLADAPPDLVSHILPESSTARSLASGHGTRDAKLLRMAMERRLKVAQHTAEGAALAQRVAALLQIAAVLRGSWRWRVGNGLLSLPRRIVLRAPRRTAMDSLAELVDTDHASSALGIATAIAQMDSHAELVDLDDGDLLEQQSGEFDLDLQDDPLEDARAAEVGADFRSAKPLYQINDLWWRAQVDVVVCVHNALEHVERCLASVLTRTTVDFRLIVVNDGSDQPTTARLRELAASHAQMEVVETSRERAPLASERSARGNPSHENSPIGYAGAANCGLRHGSADYVVLLNSDTIVPRLWIEGLLDAMSSGDNVGMVGPLSNAASWQSVPELSDADGWKVNELPAGYNVDDFGELVHALSARRFPRVAFLNGFCLMLRRSVVERIGLLDEAAFPQGYGEEDDYCLRMREAGYELAVADHCFVYHAKSKSFGARRAALARAGSEALVAKHGAAAIEAGTAQVRNCADLAHIRRAIDDFLNSDLDGDLHGEEAPHGKPSPNTCDVLFLLPVKGASGGANSVIQEAAGMRRLGVDAKVATLAKHADSFKRFYRRLFDAGDVFVFYKSVEDLYAKALHFDVVVATLWSTPALIAPFAQRHPQKLYVYYVQDYEPNFFPNDAESQAVARDSYTLVPYMVLMAKTDWICRTILDKHGRHVHRVAASLDRGVYHSRGADGNDGGSVTVAAMVRPSTSRRAPLRTLRVLEAVTKTARADVQVEIFGCEEADLKSYVAQNAAAIGSGFYRNRGVLSSDGIATLLQRADVFIDVSDYQAFGRTGLEAMACGCAVLLPAEGGVHEYAVHGDNALVVDTSLFETVVVELTKLIDDPALRRRIARQGLETARRYSIARASLSELGVFRQAWALQSTAQEANACAFKRGLAPFDSGSWFGEGETERRLSVA